MIGDEVVTLPSGEPARMGYLLPDTLRNAAVPAWDEANERLPEEKWEEHDDYAPIAPDIKTQHYSNCTNASLAGLGELLWRAAGNEKVTLSMSFLYSLCNGGRDNGAFNRDLAAKFLDTGLPLDSLAPESKILAHSWSDEVIADAKTRQALEVYQCLNWEDVGSAITRRFLIYHGFVLGNAFFNARSDGNVPSFDGSMRNGHAMYSRGLRKQNGVWRTTTPNSWGVSFAASGVGYIDKSYFWDQRGQMVNLDCYAIRALKGSPNGIPTKA